MDITVQDEHKQDLLGRTDYRVRVAHQGSTPGRGELVKTFADHFKSKPGLTVIRQINQEFGSSSSIIDASVYDSQESFDKYEYEYIKARHEKAAEADRKAAEEKAAAGAAAKEAETPAEEASGGEEKPSEEAAPSEGSKEAPAEEKSPVATEEKRESDA